MTRRIILIRHAMPDIPIGERWCIGGRTDLPLGALGRLQAALLPFEPELSAIHAVFCSTLLRARQTALPLCREPTAVEGLQEQDMGVWDGLPFTEIRARFPELYSARESDPSLLPEGAESEAALRARMTEGLFRCLAESSGDIAVVSHKSAIASLVGQRSALGYASLSVLEAEAGSFQIRTVGKHVLPELSDSVCEALLRAAGADASRLEHCRAVANLADSLCAALAENGLRLDAAAIHWAALLHDLARSEPDHAALGALWLHQLGYETIAGLVRQHHDPDSAELNEAGLLYLADKCVRGSRRVSLEERFSASLGKCRTPQALAAHRRRYELAEYLSNTVNTLCHTELT